MFDQVRSALSTAVQRIVTATQAVKGPWRQWVIRPLVTVVAATAMSIAALIYVFWTTILDTWNSDTWKDQ